MGGVRQNQIRVFVQIQIPVKQAVRGVKHRQRAAGRVGGGHGGQHHHGRARKGRHGLGHVQMLAAASARHHLAAAGFKAAHQLGDLLFAAGPLKGNKFHPARAGQALLHILPDALDARFVADEEDALPQPPGIPAQPAQRPRPLHIPAGCAGAFVLFMVCHYKTPLPFSGRMALALY